jgi:hypothetical protein
MRCCFVLYGYPAMSHLDRNDDDFQNLVTSMSYLSIMNLFSCFRPSSCTNSFHTSSDSFRRNRIPWYRIFLSASNSWILPNIWFFYLCSSQGIRYIICISIHFIRLQILDNGGIFCCPISNKHRPQKTIPKSILSVTDLPEIHLSLLCNTLIQISSKPMPGL